MKVLVATEKPFAAVAVNGIREVIEEAGYELVLLEKYAARYPFDFRYDTLSPFTTGASA